MNYIKIFLKPQNLLFIVLLLNFTFCTVTKSYSQGTIIIQEDWETGIGDWYADNGLWAVGSPTVGPDSAHSGQNCIGTVLDGNYPANANTRLISPEINLPTLTGNDKILLKFWQCI